MGWYATYLFEIKTRRTLPRKYIEHKLSNYGVTGNGTTFKVFCDKKYGPNSYVSEMLTHIVDALKDDLVYAVGNVSNDDYGGQDFDACAAAWHVTFSDEARKINIVELTNRIMIATDRIHKWAVVESKDISVSELTAIITVFATEIQKRMSGCSKCNISTSDRNVSCTTDDVD